MSHITFTSWNCRGLGKALKRGKVFSHLSSLSSDITFLQETHIRPLEERHLRAVWVSQVYQSTFSSKVRGVAILVRRTFPFVFKVECKYMFAALEKFGFGLKFMNISKMLYACPQSSVITKYERSPPFSLHRATRQGCCLSPMLFALALEPLAIASRTSPQISGINCATSECTIGMYANEKFL